jgi:hypothetical protein
MPTLKIKRLIFTAEENGIELFRFKSQHLCSIKAKELIRRRKNEKNARIIQDINELKVQGILWLQQFRVFFFFFQV